MPKSRREFIRNSLLMSVATGLNLSSGAARRFNFIEDGDRLVLLGTQGGPFVRSYRQTPAQILLFIKKIILLLTQVTEQLSNWKKQA